MPNRFDLKYYGFGPATSGSCSSLVNPFILIPLYIVSEAYLIDPNRLPKFSILDFIIQKKANKVNPAYPHSINYMTIELTHHKLLEDTISKQPASD